MILKSITELLERIPNGGVIDSNDRWNPGYLDALVGTYRARLAQAVYANNKRLHPQWYQKHWPEYDDLLQENEDCCVKFRHPEVVMLDDRSDGFRYIGSTDCNNNFARVQSRAWLSTFNNNKVTATNNKRRATVLYDGSAEILEIYGDMEIDEILTESLVANPLLIPTFNPESDQYPIPESLIPDLVGMIFNDNVATELRMPYGFTPPVNVSKYKKGK